MKKIIFIFFFISFYLFAQQEAKVDSLLYNLSFAEPEKHHAIEDSIIGILYTSELKEGKKISEYLQKILPDSKLQHLYVRILIHSWRFYTFEGKINILNNAYQVAKRLNDYNLIGMVEVYKAIAFKDNSMTDSAMTYALRARDNLEKTGKPEDLDDVRNLIADFHYYAGQYEEAELLYTQIISQPRMKNTWRYNTIQDDLGLIRIKQKKYPEAEKYFKSTINNITSREMRYVDSTALPYNFRMMLEITFLQGHYKEAEEYYNLAKKVAERFEQTEYLPAIYAIKGNIYYEQGKYDSALVFFNKAKALNLVTPSIENSITIYSGLSKAYESLKDTKNTVLYLKLLNTAEDTADSIFYRARYMTKYAEYNYNNYLREITNYKQRQTILVIFTSIIIISLIAITYYFIRLRKANKFLITKNIEAAFSNEHISLTHTNKVNEDTIEEYLTLTSTELNIDKENIKLTKEFTDDLTSRLDKIMSDEKLYLQHNLTLDKVAELLSTNRLYLSKTINSIYKINFNVYINDLRIKEAIRIISSGEHKNFNIDGIANICGFNNRVSFTKAFYKYTGVYPSYFIKHGQITQK